MKRCLTARLRPGTASDAQTLSDLAFRAKAHWGYDAAFMESCRAELTYAAEQFDLPGWRFYVVDNGAEAIAFCALRKMAGDDAELEALFVEPACIGQGTGMYMLRHAQTEAALPGATRLIIQSDPHAADFYRAAGAVAVGVRESQSIPGRELPLFALPVRHKLVRKTRRG